jgi:hypothetical protein
MPGMTRGTIGWARAVPMCAVIAACAHGGGAPIANRGTRGPAGDIRAIDWQNRTYVLDELGPVTVKDGQADFGIDDDNKAVPGGAGNGSYTVERPLFADLDGDGVEDVVIASALSTGGTGHFSEIRIYTLRAGKIVPLAMIPGGDRGDGGIRHVALDGAAILVERNVLAEGDGVCCPSGAQRERWVWRGGELVEDVTARRALPP